MSVISLLDNRIFFVGEINSYVGKITKYRKHFLHELSMCKITEWLFRPVVYYTFCAYVWYVYFLHYEKYFL